MDRETVLGSKWPSPCYRTATAWALINLLQQSVPIGNVGALRCLELLQNRLRNRAIESLISVLQNNGTLMGDAIVALRYRFLCLGQFAFEC